MLYASPEYLQSLLAERMLEAEDQRRARLLKAARRESHESRISRLGKALRRLAYAHAQR